MNASLARKRVTGVFLPLHACQPTAVRALKRATGFGQGRGIFLHYVLMSRFLLASPEMSWTRKKRIRVKPPAMG